MTTAAIKINGVLGSRDDLILSSLVTLTNNDDTGVITWAWSFVSKPPGSTAIIATPTSPTATFTPDVVGSYFIKLVVNDGILNYTDNKIGAVKTENLSIRIPAVNEQDEFDSTNGWGTALWDAFTIIDSEIYGTAGGDLSGNYPNPTVSKIQNRSVSSSAPTDAYALTWNNSLSQWESNKPIPGGAASGDLSGTYPKPTVSKLQGDSLPTKTSNSFLKRNSGNTAWEEVTYGTTSNTVCQGNDSRLSDSRSPSGSASGDLSGTYPNPTVSKIQNRSVSSALPNDGYVLVWNTTAWTPQIQDAYRIQNRKISSSTPTDGYALTWNNSLSQWESNKPIPGGTAGGDLSGIYPNPTVSKLQNESLPTKTANGFLKRNSGNTAWEEVIYGTSSNTVCEGSDSRLSDSRSPSGSASGDLSGTYPNPTVSKIQNRNVSSSLPDDGYVLVWDLSSSTWNPQIQDAYRIQNRKISSADPSDGNALMWNESLSQWEPQAVSTADEKIKITSSDTTSGYLEDKLVEGSFISLTKLYPSGNEQLIISFSGATDAYNVKVSSADTTPDFLESKIVAGSNINITKLYVGGDEQLQFAATGTGFDAYNVKVSSSDTTPDFLQQKLVEGNNIVLTRNNYGSNETLTVATPQVLKLDEQLSDPTPFSNDGYLYSKDSLGITEFYYINDSGDVVQITKDGYLNVTSIQNDNLPAKTANGFLKRNSGNTAWEEVIYGTTSNTVCQGNDSRLSDSRSPSGSASGDLSGTYPGPTVSKIQNRNVSSSAPTNNQVLKWNSSLSQWEPAVSVSDGYNVKISSGDTTPGFLDVKLISGANITLTKNNPSGNESYTIKTTSSIKLDQSGSDPSYYTQDGYLYTKAIDGYTELYYLNDYGHVSQITYDGYLAIIAREDEIYGSLGTETSLSLTKVPQYAPRRRSKFDIDVYRNGVLLRYVSSLSGAGINVWTYNRSLNRVEFNASGSSGDWYIAIYRAKN